MNEKNNGGPAFPRPFSNSRGGMIDFGKQDGMSLRDYFAATALPELQARYYGETECGDIDIARMAYAQADAMLHAREAS